ncbi:hypothetical protein NBRC10513v2_005864 [Rhodotorula toruloides]
MPVPPLPVELFGLIIWHAAWNLPQDKRFGECGRLARVCKSWTDPARRCALHALELRLPADSSRPHKISLDRLLSLPPNMLAHVQKLQVHPNVAYFIRASGSPTSSPHSLLPFYENALSALLDACPNIIDLSFWSQNMAALINVLDALKRHHLQSLAVTISLAHASHARSAGRLLASNFRRLDHLELTLHVMKDRDEPFSVDLPSAPLSVAAISLISPRRQTSWSSTVVDELFESLDASELSCAAGDIHEGSLGCRNSSMTTLSKPPYPSNDLIDLLPDSLEDVELTDWIFDIPSSVMTVHAPAHACDRLPILRLSTRRRHSGNDWTETTFLKLQFEDEVTRWLRSAPEAEADLIMSHGLP